MMDTTLRYKLLIIEIQPNYGEIHLSCFKTNGNQWILLESTGENMTTKSIKINLCDYERLQRIAEHIPQWKGKPHTQADMIAMMIDFIWDCYPDLISKENEELKPIFESGNQQYINRILWIEYVKRAWGRYIF